jgi:hypothetical protein
VLSACLASASAFFASTSAFFASASAFFCAASERCALRCASVSDLVASCNETLAAAIPALRVSSSSEIFFASVVGLACRGFAAAPADFCEGVILAGSSLRFVVSVAEIPGINEASDAKPGGSTS